MTVRIVLLLFGLCLTLLAQAQPMSLDAFLERIAPVTDEAARREMAATFVRQVREVGAPLVENDSTVVFLYSGRAARVTLVGDMNDWSRPTPLERVAATDLFYLRATYEPDARLEYGFQADDEPFIRPDALNPYVVRNGFGPFSELAMPGYTHHPAFTTVHDGRLGSYDRVVRDTLAAGVLPYGREVFVYLPPGYETSDRHYPVVYFQDGRDYIEFAHIPLLLDWLHRNGCIEPVVVVFVAPPNRFQPQEPNRATEYGLNDAYVRFFTEELVPHIDRRYRTRGDADSRLVVGDSYGGLISVYIALRRPDVFGLAYGQSGYYSFQSDRLIRMVEGGACPPVRFFLDVGTYERNVGASFLPATETDFLLANRRLRDVLAGKGCNFVYREYPEGHTWGNWRRHLADALPHFFPPTP